MNICQVCGVPLDSNYFDNASFQKAPEKAGEETELARYALHPQYCGVLLFFAQYAEPEPNQTPSPPPPKDVVQTPGYEWAVLCNNQPRDPYLPTNLILNPWGQNNLPIQMRLEEGCIVRLVVRKVSASPVPLLARVGGRLQGRYWYNNIYGGFPNRL